MQLRTATTRRASAGALAVALAIATASGASADVSGALSTTTTAFHEAGGPLEMTVIGPSAEASFDVGDAFGLRAGYTADVVSGASVAVVDGPSSSPDVITSATRLDDVRHVGGGGLRIGTETTTFRANYAYGVESDYRSHAIDVSGRAEVLERDTVLELSYARAFDQVCALAQPRAQEAVDRARLPSSDGCFGGADRASLDVSLHTLQASWSQAWTPVFATQLTLTTQIIDGFQGSPYRGVWLGRSAAMENPPEGRIRYAAGLGARVWLKPLESALQVQTRLYRDSWALSSITAELAYEQGFGAGLSLRARGRFYTQSGAVFYSDDYGRMPRGEYFTGDRELSPMSSWLVGGRLAWQVPSDDEGHVLGFMSELLLAVKTDFLFYTFDEFHYGGAAVPNDMAIIGTVSIEAGF